MRKLFLLSAVICAASFLMAAITYGIWGPDNPRHGGSVGGVTSYRNHGSIFNETVNQDKEWHINNEFTNIEVDSAAVKTLIVPTSENEMIRVCAQVPTGKSITVSAEWEDDSLCIAAHPKSVSFGFSTGGYDGFVGWLDDIFGDSNGIVITIEIPERILNTFTLKQGSGTTIVRNINAANNYFEIGSGTINFYGSGQYPQNYFNLDIGSGKACVTNMLAEHYNIDVGSGKFVVSGLKGYGEIDFGSGKGSVFYSELGGMENYYDHSVDMGSGNLDLYFPEGYSAYVNASIGSGYVNIDALGIKQKLKFDTNERVLIGSYSDSTCELNLDMGAGSVNIYDSTDEALNKLIEEYAVDEPSLPPKSDSDTAAVVDITTTPSFVESSSLSEEQSTSLVIGDVTVTSGVVEESNPPEDTDAPNPPKAPEAPNPPDAPNPPEIEQAA